MLSTSERLLVFLKTKKAEVLSLSPKHRYVLIATIFFGIIAIFTAYQFLIKKSLTENKAENFSPPVIQQISLVDLMSSGVSQKCTFQDNGEQASVVGSVLTMNGGMRIDFGVLIDGVAAEGHIIMDPTLLHMWLEGATSGTRITTEKADKNPNILKVDIRKKIDLRCQDWDGDEKYFDLPQEVSFHDIVVDKK